MLNDARTELSRTPRSYDDLWCRRGMHRRSRAAKRRYATLHDAWIAAFLAFVRYGDVMTPYRCQIVKRAIARVTIKGHPNPWSLAPYWIAIDTRELPRGRSCEGYHLTRRALGFMLPTSSGKEVSE